MQNNHVQHARPVTHTHTSHRLPTTCSNSSCLCSSPPADFLNAKPPQPTHPLTPCPPSYTRIPQGPLTRNNDRFDGHYYTEVVERTGRNGWFDSDRALNNDNAATAPLMRAFSADHQAFLNAWCDQYAEMSLLGVDLAPAGFSVLDGWLATADPAVNPPNNNNPGNGGGGRGRDGDGGRGGRDGNGNGGGGGNGGDGDGGGGGRGRGNNGGGGGRGGRGN
jgi:hypothetical protein